MSDPSAPGFGASRRDTEACCSRPGGGHGAGHTGAPPRAAGPACRGGKQQDAREHLPAGCHAPPITKQVSTGKDKGSFTHGPANPPPPSPPGRPPTTQQTSTTSGLFRAPSTSLCPASTENQSIAVPARKVPGLDTVPAPGDTAGPRVGPSL